MTDKEKSKMVRLTISLTEYEYEKLKALAVMKTKEAKGEVVTVNGCIRAFARSCQPGGGANPWKHPLVHAVEYRAKKEKEDADHQDEAAQEEQPSVPTKGKKR